MPLPRGAFGGIWGVVRDGVHKRNQLEIYAIGEDDERVVREPVGVRAARENTDVYVYFVCVSSYSHVFVFGWRRRVEEGVAEGKLTYLNPIALNRATPSSSFPGAMR